MGQNMVRNLNDFLDKTDRNSTIIIIISIMVVIIEDVAASKNITMCVFECELGIVGVKWSP